MIPAHPVDEKLRELHPFAILACLTWAVQIYRPTLAALLVTSAAAWLCWSSARRGAAAVPALNDEHPALAAAAPVVVGPGPRLARRVVLVLIDGLRADAVRGMPTLAALAARGATGLARAGFPTSSEPNYTAVLTGVPPRESGVRTNHYASAVPLESVFSRARAAGLRTGYVSQLSEIVATLFPNLDHMDSAPGPGEIDRAAVARIAAGDDFLFVLHNAPDENAHRHGAASPEYLAAKLEADRALAAIVGALDLDKDAILVVADHGHTDGGGHGGREPVVTEVPLILAGAGIRSGAILAGATTSDVAPTVAALLGLPAPGHALGRTLVEGLAVEGEAARRLLDADGSRQAALAPFVTDVARQAATAELRRGRAIAASGVLGAALLALVLAAARRWLVLDGRAVAVGAAIAGLPILVGLLVSRGPTPSFIPRPELLPGYAVWFALIFVPAQLAAAIKLVGQLAPARRLATSVGAAAVALFGAAVISACVWVLADDTLGGDFFGPAGMVLPSLANASAVFTSVTLTLFVAVELVRAGRPVTVRWVHDALDTSC